LLKRDYIPHKIQPVAGYGDLSRAGEELVKPMQTTNGGSGGVVVCLGVGGLVDLSEILCLSNPEDEVENLGGIEVWVFDARRPWNLANVFGGEPVAEQALGEIDANARRKTRGVNKGCITPSYKSSNGGIVVYDDGDIEEDMNKEREAYCALLEMPEVDDDEDDEDLNGDDSASEGEDDHPSSSDSRKRKSWSRIGDGDESDEEDGPPRQRRRSNSVCDLWRLCCFHNVLLNIARRGPRSLPLQLVAGQGCMIPFILHALLLQSRNRYCLHNPSSHPHVR
jgi:cell division control protein 45